VNQSPYDQAWFVEIEVTDGVNVSGLLDATAYRELTE
jgi:glycine cleavage system H lipoate-binding protein